MSRLFLALLMLLGLPARAEVVLPLPVWTGPPIAAIGRTFRPDRPQSGFCTGTLVAPDIILTAAHCAPAQSDGLLFVFGDPADPETLRRHVAKGLRHPVYAARGSHAPAHDLGLLFLDSPVDSIAPLPLSQTPSDIYALSGFHRFSPFVLSGSTDCPRLQQTATVMQIDCPVVSGSSGSPLLVPTAQGWQVGAVASSQAGQTLIAAKLGAWLVDTLANAD